MKQDVVDRNVQEWERIEEAVAFQMPNGDEIIITRKVPCPACKKPYVMGLATGAMVNYGRRHPSCGINQLESLREDEDDNG